jgi:hypothetical protein
MIEHGFPLVAVLSIWLNLRALLRPASGERTPAFRGVRINRMVYIGFWAAYLLIHTGWLIWQRSHQTNG